MNLFTQEPELEGLYFSPFQGEMQRGNGKYPSSFFWGMGRGL